MLIYIYQWRCIMPMTYVYIGVPALILIAILVVSIAVKKNKKKAKLNLAETKDARYTYDLKTTDGEGDAKVSFTKGDFVLNPGVTYYVGKGKDLKPGKYIILTSDNTTDKFNIRVGNYVREYSHNQEIVLADNSEITSVSHTVILR